MARPHPPAFVKMPGRPKTQRRKEEGAQSKGTKLTRVGIKMTCRLCKKSYHNARRCPKNPEAGNKVNAHIKRAKSRKRKDVESASTSVVANDQAGNRNTRAKRTATTERVTFFSYSLVLYIRQVKCSQ
jgi:hypothetical protein